MNRTTPLVWAAVFVLPWATPLAAAGPKGKITHSFLATGGETYIVDDAGKTTWTYPHASRDGWVLPSGNVLLALAKNKDYTESQVHCALSLLAD